MIRKDFFKNTLASLAGISVFSLFSKKTEAQQLNKSVKPINNHKDLEENINNLYTRAQKDVCNKSKWFLDKENYWEIFNMRTSDGKLIYRDEMQHLNTLRGFPICIMDISIGFSTNRLIKNYPSFVVTNGLAFINNKILYLPYGEWELEDFKYYEY